MYPLLLLLPALFPPRGIIFTDTTKEVNQVSWCDRRATGTGRESSSRYRTPMPKRLNPVS